MVEWGQENTGVLGVKLMIEKKLNANVERIKNTLTQFAKSFDIYTDWVLSGETSVAVTTLRVDLQRETPKIGALLSNILGDRLTSVWGNKYTITELLSGATRGDDYNSQAFTQYKNGVAILLNQAIGSIEEGLWPTRDVNPVLIINDGQLKERCHDLLQAPGKYDRVIREVTTILENRIKEKVPCDIMAQKITYTKDQTGENLVNTFFAPKKPILIVSNDEHERVAFQKILLGVFSYFRNPHHHRIQGFIPLRKRFAEILNNPQDKVAEQLAEQLGLRVIVGLPKVPGHKYSAQVLLNLPIAESETAFPNEEQPFAMVSQSSRLAVPLVPTTMEGGGHQLFHSH